MTFCTTSSSDPQSPRVGSQLSHTDGKEVGRQLAPQRLGDMKAVCTSPGMGKPQAETEKWPLPNFKFLNKEIPAAVLKQSLSMCTQ